MSDPLSNSEIQDVLSSIRRLVSEDRRTREARAPADAAPGTPVIGKLILTEALRVETVEQAPVEAEEAPFAEQAEGRLVEDTPIEVTTIVPPPVRAASVLADDIASLESTIAELEAAVAGIGAEFEPDGSEIARSPDTAEASALEDAFDEGFAVDTGDFVRVAPADDRLDEPVTGSALRPATTVSEPEPAGDELIGTATRATDEIAFLRSPGAMRRADWHVISGGEAGPAAGSAPLSRLHLRPAGEAHEPVGTAQEETAAFVSDAVQVEAETADIDAPDETLKAALSATEDFAGPDADVAVTWDVTGEAAAPAADVLTATDEREGSLRESAEEAAAGHVEDDVGELAHEPESGLAEAATTEFSETASDDASEVLGSDPDRETGPVVEDETVVEHVEAEPSELVEDAVEELAGDLPESAVGDLIDSVAGDPAAVEIPVDLDTPLLSTAGIAGAAAATALPEVAGDAEAVAGSGGEEVDLFAAGDEAVIDMEMLRELIVQVLREELQGPLGERITRNVRKLVRQEIARALEAQKFE